MRRPVRGFRRQQTTTAAGVVIPDRPTMDALYINDYTASPWADAVGSADLAEATNPPAASGGFPDFDGTNDRLTRTASYSEWFNNAGMFFYVLCDLDAYEHPFAIGVAFGDAATITDASYYALGTSSVNGGEAQFRFWTGAYSELVAPLTDISSPVLIHFRFDGTDCELGVNGTWNDSVTATPAFAGSAIRKVGESGSSTSYLNGRIMEMGFRKSSLDDSGLADLVSYLEGTHGITL